MSKAKIDTKQSIIEAIQSLAHPSNLSQTALSFFEALGYSSERQLPLSNPTYECFEDSYVKNNFHANNFKPEKALSTQWKYVDLLFQITPDELKDQLPNFSTQNKDNEIIFSYLFFALELEQNEYSRSQLSQITREINKLFTIPALILFKHGSNLTLSIIDHRQHKKDESKDVLEKVTLIKDISTKRPHRAHIEILFDLSLPEIIRKYEVSNFVELHQAWQKTLDTKELNLRFYRDLSNWYFWALHEVHFPTNNLEADKNSLLKEEEKVKEHNAKNLIRLLTRLLFVWFIKEKHLIPDELFDERYIKEKLLIEFEPHKIKDFDHKTQGSRFYRAILQNLFFATLNQTVGKREFRKDGQQMNVTNVMRYKQYFKDSSAFIKLLEDVVPFMNGGLFECLDSPDPVLKGKKGGDVILYEDGFSDRKENTLCVPDYIFFGKTEQADLSVDLGDARQKNVMVDGLINILKNYKFTVTENTPVEEDIALDPELLGRVFENLLASYNPETKSTARKQTGSFYTPREIVNYMVDESLKEHLKQKLVSEAGMKTEDANINLEFLLGYNEKENLFDEIQTSILIKAIDNCKILDPACGSGAFPMGILHKLVHILHKLDPDNKLWKEIQRQKAIKETEEAFQIGNQKERENRLKEISDVFEYNSDDYGRKLFLIENCIYGVDIQPIATQISKLRFFISLIIDQKSDKVRENFGIRPLPNLETKFVAANTLIGVDKSSNQISLFDIPEILQLEVKLKDIRHRIFSAKTPATKRKLREDDQRLREEMCNLLIQFGWGNESARKLSEWDPYNQNLSSGWFDPEWMFGINKGFDIVIGNPPYGANIDNFTILYEKLYPKTSKGYKDVYKYFFNCSLDKFLKKDGILCFITPNTFFLQPRYSDLRKVLLEKDIVMLISLGEDIFESIVPTAISLIKNGKSSNYNSIRFVDIEAKSTYLKSMSTLKFKNLNQEILLQTPSFIFTDNIRKKLDDEDYLCNILDMKDGGLKYQRTNVGLGQKGNSDLAKRLFYDGARNNESDILLLTGKDLHNKGYALNPRSKKYLVGNFKSILKKNEIVYYNRELMEAPLKIIWRQTAPFFIGCVLKDEIWFGNTIQGGIINDQYRDIISPYYLIGLLNSKYLRFLYTNAVKETGRVFPQVKLEKLKPLPIKIISEPQQRQMIELSMKIEKYLKDGKDAEANSIEIQINQIVYGLYNLTQEEINAVEHSF